MTCRNVSEQYMLHTLTTNALENNYDLCINVIWSMYLTLLLQNYSPQFDSYDVKSGVGGMGGYPGPAVSTNVSECFQVSHCLCFF